MGIGARIKDIAKKQGLTLAQLSEMTGISVNTFYSMTSRDSDNIRPKNLKKIAEALNVSESELLGDQKLPSLTGNVSPEEFINTILKVVYPKGEKPEWEPPENLYDLLILEKIKDDINLLLDELNLEGLLVAREKVKSLAEDYLFQREPENSAKKELPPAANRKQPEDE